MNDVVLTEKLGHVLRVTLNRPEKLNAIDREVFVTLPRIWDRVDADFDIRAVVLTGAGDRAFCSGADAGSLAERDQRDLGDPTKRYPRFTARQWGTFKPVITAVNGVCAGAGLHFVADGDIVICSENATFVDPHVNVGQVTALEPIGLARRVPLGAVLRMVILAKAERLDARRAYELGLVSEVVPSDQLQDRAMELAEIAASVSPRTLQTSLKAIWQSLDLGLAAGYQNGWNLLTAHWDHPDSKEGPSAFLEKREPTWVP